MENSGVKCPGSKEFGGKMGPSPGPLYVPKFRQDTKQYTHYKLDMTINRANYITTKIN